MRIPLRPIVSSLALLALGPVSGAQEWWNTVRHSEIQFGGRFLSDDEFWAPLDEPFVVGFGFDSFDLATGFGWESSLYFTVDGEDDLGGVPGDDATLFFLEAGIGARYTLQLQGFHPYVGVGVAGIYSELTVESGPVETHEEDWTFGGYARTGAWFRAGPSTTFGFDVRGLFGTDLDLGSFGDTNVDGVQVTASFGWAY